MLSYQHEAVGVEDHAEEPDDVVVVERVHDGGLLQELRRPVLHLLLAQALDGHLNLKHIQHSHCFLWLIQSAIRICTM